MFDGNAVGIDVQESTVTYRKMRATARVLGLGRLQRRLRTSIEASPLWVAAPPRHLKDLDLVGPARPDTFALTYDDGPDPEVTPRLLDALEVHGAKATFFMCGLAAHRCPDLVRAVADAGHSIGGHSWSHRHVESLTESEWKREIDETHSLLADLSGRPVRWFRPPRGKTDRGTWERLRLAGVTTVLWSAAGRDWRFRSAALIAQSALSDLGPGGIVLLHDSLANLHLSGSCEDFGNQEPTVQATEILLRAARDLGLSPVALDVIRSTPLPRMGQPRLLSMRKARSHTRQN